MKRLCEWVKVEVFWAHQRFVAQKCLKLNNLRKTYQDAYNYLILLLFSILYLRLDLT